MGCQFVWGISSVIGKAGQLQGEGHQANVVPIYFLLEYFVSVSRSWRSSGWEAASPEGAGADAREQSWRLSNTVQM